MATRVMDLLLLVGQLQQALQRHRHCCLRMSITQGWRRQSYVYVGSGQYTAPIFALPDPIHNGANCETGSRQDSQAQHLVYYLKFCFRPTRLDECRRSTLFAAKTPLLFGMCMSLHVKSALQIHPPISLARCRSRAPLFAPKAYGTLLEMRD